MSAESRTPMSPAAAILGVAATAMLITAGVFFQLRWWVLIAPALFFAFMLAIRADREM